MISRPARTMDDLRAVSSEYAMSILLLVCTDPAWSHLVDDVIATGVDVKSCFGSSERTYAPGLAEHTPLCLAIYNGILPVASALVAAGADPVRLGRLRRNIIHNALFYDSSGVHDMVEVVKYAIELYPGGVNGLDGEGRSPLQIAVDTCAPRDVISLLLSSGCSTRTLVPMKYSDEIIGRSYLVPLLVAYGYRVSIGEDDRSTYYRTEDFDPLVMMECTEQCRSVARVILGLGRVKGHLLGNGRDVLRLVAKEVWLSRMDEGWLDR